MGLLINIFGFQGISDELKGAIITALVSAIITIIGFIVTNLSIKKNFQNELKRARDNMALEKMATMPYEILTLMDQIIENNSGSKKKNVNSDVVAIKHHKEILNQIYSYGTESAIRIAALMQKEIYSNFEKNFKQYRAMALFVLLATQIKFDVTGIIISPELWFQMRITDYSDNKVEIMKENNQLVKELELMTKFNIR